MNTIRRMAMVVLLLTVTATASSTVARASSPPAIAPSLGSAVSYPVLAGTTVTNTGTTTVMGDLGVSPETTAITGFVGFAGQGQGQGVVSGVVHQADPTAAGLQTDVTAAYTSLADQTCGSDLSGKDLGTMTLTPGVYCFSSSAQLTGILTLDGGNNPNAVFVVKIGSTLTTASSATVNLINGATSGNVFWQVGSSATLGTGTTFAGSVLALTSITLTTGAKVAGRVMARNGAVTMDTNQVTVPSKPTWAAVSRLTFSRKGGMTHIRWYSTARVLGFNVYTGTVQLNHHLITSHNGWYHFNTRRILDHVSVSSSSISG